MTKRQFNCTLTAGDTLSYIPDLHDAYGSFTIRITEDDFIADCNLSPEDQVAMAVDLLTINLEREDADVDSIVALAKTILDEYGETEVIQPQHTGKTEVIFDGPAFTFSRDQTEFYILNNAAEMGGAYMMGSTFKYFARAVASAAGLEIGGEKEERQKPSKPRRYSALSEQSQLVFRHMQRAGSISAREAMSDHGITSATLARRICDIEERGWEVVRERRVNPITGQRYTRYSLA